MAATRPQVQSRARTLAGLHALAHPCTPRMEAPCTPAPSQGKFLRNHRSKIFTLPDHNSKHVCWYVLNLYSETQPAMNSTLSSNVTPKPCSPQHLPDSPNRQIPSSNNVHSNGTHPQSSRSKATNHHAIVNTNSQTVLKSSVLLVSSPLSTIPSST